MILVGVRIIGVAFFLSSILALAMQSGESSARAHWSDIPEQINAQAVIGVSESRVITGSDDAEEFPIAGTVTINPVNLTSVDLEIVRDSQTEQVVGIRFTNNAVPRGVSVTNAYIQFTVDETDGQPVTVTVQAEAADNAQTFTSTLGNISARPRTNALVKWSPVPWRTVNAAEPEQRTPNLALVIQEVIERPGWSINQAIAIIFTADSGLSRRTAIAFERNPDAAPLLYIEYEIDDSTPIDQLPPVVQAGPDQNISLGEVANLQGSVDDDGLPDPPGEVTTNWSRVSGPGLATFSDNAALNTSASFTLTGSYTLRLTANDGELSGVDEVTITVEEAGGQDALFFPFIMGE